MVVGALVAALPGLLMGGFGEATGGTVESLRGEPVTLYGRGLYEFDSRFVGAGNRATDAVVLLGGVPLLVIALQCYRRSSPAGELLLLGTFAFFLYVYGTYAVGIAYNRLFLLYVVIFSASLFALVRLANTLFDRIDTRAFALGSRRRLGWFMLASGAVLVVVWGLPLLASLVDGSTPARLDTYTAFVTYALDLGVILPAAITSGVLLLEARREGYVVAAGLLVIEVFLAPLIGLQTLVQLDAGEDFTAVEVMGPIGGFVVLAGIAAVALLSILRATSAHGLAE